MRLRVVMGALRFGAYLQFLAARPPRENTVSLQERLASFPAKETPVEKRVEIRWNRHQVPFIEARTEPQCQLRCSIPPGNAKIPLAKWWEVPPQWSLNTYGQRSRSLRETSIMPAFFAASVADWPKPFALVTATKPGSRSP